MTRRQHIELPEATRPIPIPPAFRGNCACGKWVVVGLSWTKNRPLKCECGRSLYWQPMNSNILAVQEFEGQGVHVLLYTEEESDARGG